MKPGGYILTGMGIAAAILIGFLVGRRCARIDPGDPQIPKVDTLVIRDTIKVTEAKYITRRVVDSVPYPVTDIIRMRDTLYVFLERSQIAWEDSLARVYASGIDPQVDSVIHFTQERVIIKEIPAKKSRWGVGLQGGVGASRNGLSPYIGIGVTYDLFSFTK